MLEIVKPVAISNCRNEVIIWRHGEPQETLDDYAARTQNKKSLACLIKPVKCRKTVQESCGACGEFGSYSARRRQRLLCRDCSHIL